MIAEHATAVIMRDLPERGLKAGDFGVVIHIHTDPQGGRAIGYLIERFAANGDSLDEISVPADSVRAAQANDRVRIVAAE